MGSEHRRQVGLIPALQMAWPPGDPAEEDPQPSAQARPLPEGLWSPWPVLQRHLWGGQGEGAKTPTDKLQAHDTWTESLNHVVSMSHAATRLGALGLRCHSWGQSGEPTSDTEAGAAASAMRWC